MDPYYIPEKPTSAREQRVWRSLLLVYLLLVLLPLALKLTHVTRVAAWPWAVVTAPVWLPWVLLVALSGLGWLLRLRRRG